jgi:HEAT repeat protein
MIVLALGKTRNPHAIPVLLHLLDDDSVAGHAVQALGTLHPPGIRAAIEPCTTHSVA